MSYGKLVADLYTRKPDGQFYSYEEFLRTASWVSAGADAMKLDGCVCSVLTVLSNRWF